jgi:hypothetical protein
MGRVATGLSSRRIHELIDMATSDLERGAFPPLWFFLFFVTSNAAH